MDNLDTTAFGFKDKIGYMFGDFGNDFTFIFASTYLMVFYTKVWGIDAAMVGVLFMVARCVDAFTDVGMGRVKIPGADSGYGFCACLFLWQYPVSLCTRAGWRTLP